MEPSSPAGNLTKGAMETISRKPKLGETAGHTMTLSGGSDNDDSLVSEATQTLLDFALAKGTTLQAVAHMTSAAMADMLREFYGKVKLRNDDPLSLKDLRAGLHKYFLMEVRIVNSGFSVIGFKCF